MPPIDESKNVRIVFVVSHETRQELETLAKKDRRPLGAYLRNLCEDHVSTEKLAKLESEGGDGVGIFPPPQL